MCIELPVSCGAQIKTGPRVLNCSHCILISNEGHGRRKVCSHLTALKYNVCCEASCSTASAMYPMLIIGQRWNTPSGWAKRRANPRHLCVCIVSIEDSGPLAMKVHLLWSSWEAAFARSRPINQHRIQKRIHTLLYVWEARSDDVAADRLARGPENKPDSGRHSYCV